MGKSCCIEGCDVSSPDVEYFKFPRSGALLAAWIEATGAPGGDVCSAHFTDADYKSMRGKRRLLGTAVPSVFVSVSYNYPQVPPQRSPAGSLDRGDRGAGGFPRSGALLAAWIEATGAPGGDVCSAHFTDADYKSMRGKRRLLGTAVPSVFVSKPSTENGNITDPTKDTNKNANTNPKNKKAKEKKSTKKAKADSTTDNINKIATDNNAIDKDESTTDTDVTENNVENGESSQETRQGGEENGKQDKNGVIENDQPEVNDIEDMITNYQIKQPPLADRLNPDPLEDLIPAILEKQSVQELQATEQVDIEVEIQEETRNNENTQEVAQGKLDVNQLANHIANKLDNQLAQIMATAPVFIEVAVDQNDTRAESPQDCLMLLESVQCDIDPSSLMLPEHGPDTDSDMEIVETDNKTTEDPNPISLLTSSDEDEVIIEEPHIDTVEVSDETDEDDRPLQRLIKEKPKQKKPEKKKKKGNFEYFVHSSPYYCVQCDFRTDNEAEFIRHNIELGHINSTTIQVCSTCNYTTASKAQYSRHKRKHRDERNFKCHLCNYKARHSMSLIYHLRCHDPVEKKQEKFTCDKCGFSSNVKSEALNHLKNKSCEGNKYSCDQCSYSTKRRNDLRRHRLRRHSVDDSDEDFTI
ncbi:zinc finger and SCAN domain-containing protein 10-like [Cydia strobilella]|uniref:zinc finger and SCAN domain-containing protein 10-like n=1 Tax=Cydia strobilella TaxID=1100964 RepID=UPI0030056E61